MRRGRGSYFIALTVLLHLGAGTGAWARDELDFVRLSIDQGLAQSSVLAMLQDHHGFMWLGTRGGLNRFDGHDFLAFKHRTDDPDTLSDNLVYALHEDGSGVLWVGTFEGLDRFDPRRRRFHSVPLPGTSDPPPVTAITEDGSGTLWVGTRGGLYRLERRAERLTPVRTGSPEPAGPDPHDVTVLLPDADGSLWIGTDAGLFRFDPRTGESQRLMRQRIGALVADGEEVWIGTTDGLWRWQASAGRVARHPLATGGPAPDVRALHLDDDGRLWLGTAFDGLWAVDPTGATSRYRHDPDDPGSLSSNRVSALYEDATGVLWIATLGGGLSRLVRDHRGIERREVGAGQVRALLADRSGSLWVGAEEGLHRFDRRTGERLPVVTASPDAAPGAPVSALAEDGDGSLWIGTRGAGLAWLDAATGHRRRFVHDDTATSLSHDTVTTLFVDRTHDLWVGTPAGLDRLPEGGEAFVRHRHDPEDPASLSNDLVNAIAEDLAGRLWVGTYVGLSRLDRSTGRFTRYRRDPESPGSLRDSRIWSIHPALDGRIWIGTSGGLHLYDPVTERFARFTRGGESDVVYGILSDVRGVLWLSTDGGIVTLDPVTGRFAEEKPEDRLRIGDLQITAHHRSTDGELFFGSGEGFLRIHPDRVRQLRHPPPVVLTGLRKLGEEVELAALTSELEEIVLSWEDRLVAFELALLDYGRPEAHRFSYMLEGRDDDWVDNGTRREVTVRDLPGGEYVLRARGSVDGSIWSDRQLAVRVRVTPPWWETVGFLTTALGILTITAFGVVRWRVKRLRQRSRELEEHNAILSEEIERRLQAESDKQQIISELEMRNAEMERFAYAVSHDLRNPVFTIEGFLGLLEKDARSGDARRVADDIRRIRNATRTMRDLLAEILNISRIGRVVGAVERVALRDLAYEAVDGCAGRIAERGVEVAIAEELPIVRGERRRLLEVFQILIDNAVRFMGDQASPRVEIGQRRAGAGGEERICFVRDNGVGIDPPYHEKVFGLFERLDAEGEGAGVGLAVARRVIEFHGGRIWIESGGRGRGSTICFALPEAVPEEVEEAAGD